MKVIASYSIKGGVGKTAASVNLAYAAAKAGYKTLLVDLDPQGASSFYFRTGRVCSFLQRKSACCAMSKDPITKILTYCLPICHFVILTSC